MKALTLVLPLALFATSLTHAQGFSREKGAIYLEDFMPEEDGIVLKVAHEAPIFYQLDGKRRLGTLEAGYEAELIAISDKAYMVRAKAKHANVKGWVTPLAFQKHDGDTMVKTLKELYQRQLLVQDLIDKNQVALGMTVAEVKRSLGDPDRVTSTITAEGKRDSLEFITYERVLQTVTRRDVNGFLVQDLVPVKVETGRTTIDFTNDLVVSINNTEGAPNLSSGVTIAPPPLLVY